MEKLESPEEIMDISENCTTDSVSPTTISNLHADSELAEEKNENIEKILRIKTKKSLDLSTKDVNDQESIVNQNTLNLSVNSHQQSTSTQRLTPVSKHPLIFDDDEEEGSSCSISRNFPDVVLMTHNKLQNNQQPLRLNQSSATTNGAANINSVNNNDGRNRIIPKYREPSPVSNYFRSSWMFFELIP